MPSNPTTLAELVAALEAQGATERRFSGVSRTIDLMERAAKVLRVPSEVRAALLQDAADETHSDGFREVARRIAAMFDAAVIRALGGSDVG